MTQTATILKLPAADTPAAANDFLPASVRAPAPAHVASEPAPATPRRIPWAEKYGWGDKLGRLIVATVPTALMLCFVLLVWQIVCQRPGSHLPPPSVVWSSTSDLILHPFYDHGGTDVGIGLQLAASLKRVALGFSIAAVVGVLLGVLIGQSVVAFRALDPIFQVLRTVPPLAWLPISLAAFQKADPSAIFVIFITAVWPIILNTAVGVTNIPQNYRNVSRVLQLSGPEFFFKIMLPSTVPYIFTGLRLGIGMSWLAIVAAEMLIGGVGIGFFIWDSWNSSLISEIIVALVYVGIVGFCLDRFITFIGRLIAGDTVTR